MAIPRKFTGDLRHIAPNKIIHRTKIDKLDDFFLTLAYIYNDLKGLSLIFVLFTESFDPPTGSEPTPHRGEYHGLNLHYIRLLCAAVFEFLEFLEKNKNIINSGRFKFAISRLPKNTKEVWEDFINAANRKRENNNKVIEILLKIRSELTFHYWGAPKILRKSFIDFFFNKPRQDGNNYAYYSNTKIMKSSRFYYADAAAAEYFQSITAAIPNFDNKLLGIVENINTATMLLMKDYLANRPSRPN